MAATTGNVRFKFKVAFLDREGNPLMGSISCVYTDSEEIVSTLKTINHSIVHSIVIYREIKKGLDWEEVEKVKIPYDPKKKRTPC